MSIDKLNTFGNKEEVCKRSTLLDDALNCQEPSYEIEEIINEANYDILNYDGRDYDTDRLIKLAASMKYCEDSFLFKLDRRELFKYNEKMLTDTLIKNYLLGVRKVRSGKELSIQYNRTKLVKEIYRGAIFGRAFDHSNLDDKLDKYNDILCGQYGRGITRMTVMLHPQGYTNNPECNYFIGKCVNVLLNEGYESGDVIFFICKLALGLTSEKLCEMKVDKEDMLEIMHSVLGPWHTVAQLEKSGFCNYGTPKGMYVDGYKIDALFNYDFSDINTFSDLISEKPEEFVCNSLRDARKEFGDSSEEIEKFLNKLSSLEGKYYRRSYLLDQLDNVVRDRTLNEIKSIASEIRKEEKYKRELSEQRRSECCKKIPVKKVKK